MTLTLVLAGSKNTEVVAPSTAATGGLVLPSLSLSLHAMTTGGSR